MTDFINVSELPVLESYSEGDTTLVLHEDKLYQCPEGGGGGSDSGAYVFVIDMATGQITHNGETAIFSELMARIRNHEVVIAQLMTEDVTVQISTITDDFESIRLSGIIIADIDFFYCFKGYVEAGENDECVIEADIFNIAVTPITKD